MSEDKKTNRSLAAMKKFEDFDSQMLPFERFKEFGARSLTDAELLAILIRCGTKDKTPIQIGKEILKEGAHYERGLSGITHLSVDELLKISGIGEVKAIQINCIGELSRRISMQKAKPSLDFSNPGTIAFYYMEQLRHEETEVFMLISLNRKLRLINDKILYRGFVDKIEFSPKDIFRQALRSEASYIVILHNHPSGDARASLADKRTTANLYEMGKSLGIELYDHVIIGDNTYTSFRELDLLK